MTRPFALTSQVIMILKQLLLRSLRPQTKHALDPLQFAYWEKTAMEDAIVFLLHRSLAHLRWGSGVVRITFLDLSSAFTIFQPLVFKLGPHYAIFQVAEVAAHTTRLSCQSCVAWKWVLTLQGLSETRMCSHYENPTVRRHDPLCWQGKRVATACELVDLLSLKLKCLLVDFVIIHFSCKMPLIVQYNLFLLYMGLFFLFDSVEFYSLKNTVLKLSNNKWPEYLARVLLSFGPVSLCGAPPGSLLASLGYLGSVAKWISDSPQFG